MVEPKVGYLSQFLIIEYADTVRRPEKRVTHYYICEIFEAFLFGKPFFKAILKNMGCDFHD